MFSSVLDQGLEPIRAREFVASKGVASSAQNRVEAAGGMCAVAKREHCDAEPRDRLVVKFPGSLDGACAGDWFLVD